MVVFLADALDTIARHLSQSHAAIVIGVSVAIAFMQARAKPVFVEYGSRSRTLLHQII